jgi:hypothetical protein
MTEEETELVKNQYADRVVSAVNYLQIERWHQSEKVNEP